MMTIPARLLGSSWDIVAAAAEGMGYAVGAVSPDGNATVRKVGDSMASGAVDTKSSGGERHQHYNLLSTCRQIKAGKLVSAIVELDRLPSLVGLLAAPEFVGYLAISMRNDCAMVTRSARVQTGDHLWVLDQMKPGSSRVFSANLSPEILDRVREVATERQWPHDEHSSGLRVFRPAENDDDTRLQRLFAIIKEISPGDLQTFSARQTSGILDALLEQLAADSTDYQVERLPHGDVRIGKATDEQSMDNEAAPTEAQLAVIDALAPGVSHTFSSAFPAQLLESLKTYAMSCGLTAMTTASGLVVCRGAAGTGLEEQLERLRSLAPGVSLTISTRLPAEVRTRLAAEATILGFEAQERVNGLVIVNRKATIQAAQPISKDEPTAPSEAQLSVIDSLAPGVSHTFSSALPQAVLDGLAEHAAACGLTARVTASGLVVQRPTADATLEAQMERMRTLRPGESMTISKRVQDTVRQQLVAEAASLGFATQLRADGLAIIVNGQVAPEKVQTGNTAEEQLMDQLERVRSLTAGASIVISSRQPAEVRTRLAAEATILGFEAQERVNGLVIVNRKATIQAAQPISKDEPTAPSEAQLSVIDSLAPGVSHTFSSALPQAVLEGLAEHAAACGLTARVTASGLVVQRPTADATLEAQMERMRTLRPGESMTISKRVQDTVRQQLVAEAASLGFATQLRADGLAIIVNGQVAPEKVQTGNTAEEQLMDQLERVRSLTAGASIVISSRQPAEVRTRLAAEATILGFEAQERVNGLVIVNRKATIQAAQPVSKDEPTAPSEAQLSVIDTLAPGSSHTFSSALPQAVLDGLAEHAAACGLTAKVASAGLVVMKAASGTTLEEQLERLRNLAPGASLTISTRLPAEVRTRLAAEATILGFEAQERVNGLVIVNRKATIQAAQPISKDEPTAPSEAQLSVIDTLAPGSSHTFSSALPQAVLDGLAEHAAACGLTAKVASAGLVVMKAASGTTLEEQLERLRNLAPGASLTISTRLPAEVRTRLAAEATILGFETQERVNGLVIVNRKATIQAAQPISKDEPTAPSEAQLSVIDSLAPGVSHTFSSALPQAVLDGLAEHAAACGLTARVTASGLVVQRPTADATLEAQMERMRTLRPGESMTISKRVQDTVRQQLVAEAASLGFATQLRADGLAIIVNGQVAPEKVQTGNTAEEQLMDQLERVRSLTAGASIVISSRQPAEVRTRLAAEATILGFEAQERVNGLVIVNRKATIQAAQPVSKDEPTAPSEAQLSVIDSLAPGVSHTFSSALPQAVLDGLAEHAAACGLTAKVASAGLVVMKAASGTTLEEQLERLRNLAPGASLTISTRLPAEVRTRLAAEATILGFEAQERVNGLVIVNRKATIQAAQPVSKDEPTAPSEAQLSVIDTLAPGSSHTFSSALPQAVLDGLAEHATACGLTAKVTSAGLVVMKAASGTTLEEQLERLRNLAPGAS
jgi:hypothetical protein